MKRSLLLLVLFASMALADEKPKNLLENGGFEKKLDGWMFRDNSGRAKAQVERKKKKQGKYALHITKSGGMPVDVLRADIQSVPAGGQVQVSAQVMGKGVGNAFLKFWVYDAAGKSLVSDVDVRWLNGSFSWMKVERTFDLPNEAASAAVMLVMVLGGDLWIDDVRVEEQDPPPELDTKTRSWLDENALQVESLDFDAPPDDLERLREVFADVRIVQLGEESHGDGPAFRAKARLARFLHEYMGFDVIAFEAGMFECGQANALLGEGKVREAMFASVPGIWRVQEVRPLFAYMAETAKGGRPLQLAGFDLQATGAGALEFPRSLAAFLGDEDVFDDDTVERMTNTIRRIWDGEYRPSRRERQALRAGLEHIARALEERKDALVAAQGERKTAFMARALENFRLWVWAEGEPKKGKWDAINARDARMAGNFRWLADTYYPGVKIIAWGATMHFIHGAQGIREGRKQTYKGCRPMGEAVHEAYGQDVYAVGFAAHHGQKGTPFWGPFVVPVAPEGSIEDTLHRYGEPLLFVDFRRQGIFHEKLQCGPLGYSRDMVAVWPDVIDGLFFIDRNVPSTPLGR